MTEEKYSGRKGKQVPGGAGKKINSDILKWVVIGLAGFAVVVLIFAAGMAVGGMKAKFSYRWAESYHKNFAGPRGGFFGDWRSAPPIPGDFIEGHGAFGEIIEIKEDGFAVKGRGDVEKAIKITEDTVIKNGMETIEDGLSVGDRVVIIGSPNEDGQIEAKLIRTFNGEDAAKPKRQPRFPFSR
ncbi:hypothetical protein KKH38_02245 [Patescibacteria group bacterium]|nr:hypothetical protein [Patescibacteria group bacterium]MBU4600517.1 hypothetical protein [Patescibacteria group bacterium]MCG2698108.1 DUF5666 domain-containing protein [Candidatus Parcubacteria bacterium]